MNLFILGRAEARLAMTVFLLTPLLSMAQVKVAPGNITTIAGDQALGNTAGPAEYTGDGGPATGAQLYLPFQAVFTGGNLYIADQADNVIRYVTGATGVITTLAGNGDQGFTKDGIAATSSSLSTPTGVWVDGSGNLYIADTGNSVIRLVTAKTGIITTVVGVEGSPGYQGDGFGAGSANLLRPSSIVFDSAGNMYIADSGNNVIRKVTSPTSANPNVISTYAGQYNGGVGGYLGDGKPATMAQLNDPVAIALDSAGNLYIADSNNSVIRRVTASTGIISTIAGQGPTAANYSGDGAPAVFAHINHPKGVAVDAAGNVYISDTFNQCIRMVAPSGIINTVVGTAMVGKGCTAGYSGDGGPATLAQLNFPANLSIDSAGNIYIADNNNNVIRQYAPAPASAGGVISASSFGAFTAIAPGSWIEIYGSNLATTTGGWTSSSFTGVNAPTSLGGTTVNIAGISAFVDYVSPGQVNAQVPSGVGPGTQNLVVTNANGQKTAYTVTVNSTEPGLWAPEAFELNGKQYVGAQLPADGSWALPVPVPGYTSRFANPGEIMIMYGVGFGPVMNPTIPAGQIVEQLNELVEPLQVYFGSTQAQVNYAGLAPQLVGVYQFNVVVPNIAQNTNVPLTFVLGGVNIPQTLYTAVQ